MAEPTGGARDIRSNVAVGWLISAFLTALYGINTIFTQSSPVSGL